MLLQPLGNNVDSPICKTRVVEAANQHSQSLSPLLIVICAHPARCFIISSPAAKQVRQSLVTSSSGETCPIEPEHLLPWL